MKIVVLHKDSQVAGALIQNNRRELEDHNLDVNGESKMLLRIIEAVVTGFFAALIMMFLIFDLTKLKRFFNTSQ